MKNVVSVFRMDKQNIGDMRSCPALYFPLIGEKIDYFRIQCEKEKMTGKNVVIGGGGSVDYSPFLTEDIIAIRGCNPRRMVMWGVGTNKEFEIKEMDGKKKNPSYDVFKHMDLVGCRDWNSGFDWVPCASCMSGLFEKYRDLKPEHKCVVYCCSSHKPTIKLHLPEMTNTSSFEDVIRFLASAETVISTSYHGVYWATLLGRKVIVVNPWSTKFAHMKHMPFVVEGWGNVFDVMSNGVSHEGALEECREVNVAFARKVLSILE